MFRTTRRALFWLLTNLALAQLSAGCADPATDDSQGGSGGSTTTATAGSPGSGGAQGGGGQGGSEPACATKVPAKGASFSPATGPYGARFTHVAASSTAVLASTGFGVHRSTDGGDTWESVDAMDDKHLDGVAALGADLFLTTGKMVYRSTDAGATWKETCTDVCGAPSYLSSSAGALYLLDSGFPYRWDAVGGAWEALPTDDQLFFDVLESDGQFLYANSLYLPGVFRLDLLDMASGWKAVPGLPEWGYRAFAFSGNHGFAGNITGLFRTEDGGATWGPASFGPEQTVTLDDLLVVGDKVFAASSAGLRVTEDGGDTWTSLDERPFTSGFALSADASHVFVATRGLLRSAAPSGDFAELPVMAATIQALHPTREGMLAYVEGSLYRTTDGGGSWKGVTLPEGQYYGPAVPAVPFGDKLFALGQQAVLISDDDGASFTALPLEVTKKGYATLLVPFGDGLLLGVTEGVGSPCPDAQSQASTLYKSKDGASWQPAGLNLPTTFVDCYDDAHPPAVSSLVEAGGALVIGTVSDGIFYSMDQGASWTKAEIDGEPGFYVRITSAGGVLLASRLAQKGVLRSEDFGKTWKSGALGEVDVLGLVASGDSVFAAGGGFSEADGGVFHSPDRGATWASVDTSFSTQVRSVGVLGDSVFAGTSSRSVWTAPLSCAPAP